MTDPTPKLHTRRTWPWIAGLIAVIIALVVVLAVVLSDRADDGQPSAAPTHTATAAPAPTSPNGCLGGKTVDNAMLLDAQKNAPDNSTGAVEFTTALVRWTTRRPLATPAEAAAVEGSVMSRDAAPGFANLVAQVKSGADASGGLVPPGHDFTVSMTLGVWHIDSFTPDQATVSVGGNFVVDGAISPDLDMDATFTVVWQHGAWRVLSGQKLHTTKQLFAVGTQFTEGC